MRQIVLPFLLKLYCFSLSESRVFPQVAGTLVPKIFEKSESNDTVSFSRADMVLFVLSRVHVTIPMASGSISTF